MNRIVVSVFDDEFGFPVEQIFVNGVPHSSAYIRDGWTHVGMMAIARYIYSQTDDPKKLVYWNGRNEEVIVKTI